MKKNNIFYKVALMALAVMPLASCDDYLDVLPDNRAEIDTEDKVVSLLTSAYPTMGSHLYLTEMMSDNVDDLGNGYTAYSDRFTDQVYAWRDITEVDNDGDRNYWVDAYHAIAAANLALESIEKLGGATTLKLKEAKGEALLCRAYNHFMLVNVFGKNYNSETSTTDLGIPYVTVTEHELNPQYSRGTVAGVYESIEKDLLEGLAIIGDTHLKVPKWHFNKQAAYAFAARFYLYYEKWAESVKYADMCLGANPKPMLRDWAGLYELPDIDAQTRAYISSSSKSNMLLLSSISAMGLWCNGYAYRSKYSHNEYVADTEGIYAEQMWGDEYSIKYTIYAGKRGPLNIVFMPKLPYLFEELDAVNHTGYYRTVYPAFKTDLTLLERAEAYVMLKQYDKACDDLNLWMKNFANTNLTLTPENIQEFYNKIAYHKWNEGTLKKHLHPAFAIDAEGSVQETMLHHVLNSKRVETGYEGYRWFDVKRYGITVHRRVMDETGIPMMCTDSLVAGDPRRALQIPQESIAAGIQPNPRTNDAVTDSPTQYVSKVERGNNNAVIK